MNNKKNDSASIHKVYAVLTYKWKNCQIGRLELKPTLRRNPWYEDNLKELISCLYSYIPEEYLSRIITRIGSVCEMLRDADSEAFDAEELEQLEEEEEDNHVPISFITCESEFNSGNGEQGICEIIDKSFLTAMRLFEYMGYTEGNIVFISPHIVQAVLDVIRPCLTAIDMAMHILELHFIYSIIPDDDLKI